MASREPQRPEIDANRRREPLKRINLSGQLALMGETRRFRPFFRKLLGPQRTRALHQGQGRELLASPKRLGVKCDLVPALSDSTNLGVAGLHPP